MSRPQLKIELAGPGADVSGELATLRAASLALTSGYTLEARCAEFLHRAAGGLLAGSGAIFLVAEDGSSRMIASTGLEEVQDMAFLEGVAAWVAKAGLPISLADPGRTGVHAPRFGQTGQDALAIPLHVEDQVLGVMVLIRPLQAPAFSERDLALASVLATELAQAIERFHMKEALEHRLAEAILAQRQVEAYALDIRGTFAAEKERAEQLAEALDELRRTYLATVHGLAVAVEAKDEYTAGHLVRVTGYGLMMMEIIAPELAGDPQFEYGFLLHDIGKLGVPDAVLTKIGPLTDEEWPVMRLHSETGRRIIEGIPFLAGAKEIVYAHHERWDGEGYPRGLKGEEIPLGARVFPIADSFDAMTSDRPYRQAMPVDAALEELRRGSGTQFWPDAVEAFLSIPIEEIDAIRTGPNEWRPELGG